MVQRNLLSILYLITIATLSESAEANFTKFSILFQGPKASFEKINSFSAEMPNNEFIAQFNNLLKEKNEPKIIAFLMENHLNITENLTYILQKIFKFNLMQVLHYLRTAFKIDNNELIETAINGKAISWVQEFTHFDNYVSPDEILNDIAFCKDNHCSTATLNTIIAYKGINYYNLEGSRYLQAWIKNAINASNFIINFISNSSPEQLNTQDKITGSTPLLEATFAWQQCKNDDNDLGMNVYTFIIQKLLKKGANPNLTDNEHVCPKQLEFFKIYTQECTEWELEGQQAQAKALTNARTNSALKKK